MTGRGVVLMGLALVAAPALALADQAVPRDGGSSSSSSAGSSHHSSSGGGSSSSSNDSGSSSSSSADSSSSTSSSSSESATLTDAQRRHPRAGTGHGYGGVRDRGDHDRGGYYGGGYYGGGYYGGGYYGGGYYGGGYYGGGYPYSGRYYGPSWYGYDFSYSPYYYSGSYGYSPRYSRYRESGSLRLQVQPEKTRVYVDGYYAGIADDFDGLLQRLYLPPGRHEVTLKLDGYRNHTFKLYVPIDQTIKVHHEMIRGAGDGTVDVVGGPVDYARLDERERDGGRDRDFRRDRNEDDADEAPDDGLDRDDAGSLRLRVQPGDASVYVDGRFHGAGRSLESLRLSPGKHRVEVVRPGYRTVEREVDVSRGRSAELDIDLSKE